MTREDEVEGGAKDRVLSPSEVTDPAEPDVDRRRWDSDTRFAGVADAAAMAGHVRLLLEACCEPGWVCEDADTYVGISIREACEGRGSRWRWVSGGQDDDGTYVVNLEHDVATDQEIWEDALALLSATAEDSFHVRRKDARTIECVTGMLHGDGRFAPHGHTIRLLIAPSHPEPPSAGT